MKWKNVEDKPRIQSKYKDVCKRVIACDKYRHVFICFYRSSDNRFIDEHKLNIINDITHWTELPNAPF